MKKILYLLFALPLLGLISSCDDDKDLPDVTFSMDYSGASCVDDVLYVVQGDTLYINALNVTPAEGTKKATLGLTTYYWDFSPFYSTITVPFSTAIATEGIEPGDHMLQVRTTIYQVDKEQAFGLFSYKVVIVPTDEDQPGDGNGGTVAPEAKITDSEN